MGYDVIFSKIKLMQSKTNIYKIDKINLCCGIQKIPEYIGVDFLEGTAEIILDLRYENLPFEDNSVEKLVCISAINYFKYERAREIIQEVYRVLKPGGKLVMLTPNLESLGHKLFNDFWLGLDPPRHLFLFTEKTLLDLTKRSGFKRVKVASTARVGRFNCLISYNLKKYDQVAYSAKPKTVSRLVAAIYDKIVRLWLLWNKKIGDELMLVAMK